MTEQPQESEFGLTKSLLYGSLITVSFFVILEVVAHFWEYSDVEAEMARKVTGPQVPGSYRVFLFGGSTMEGVHVPEYGFAHQLEFWLRRLHPDKNLEVYNFGRAGRDSGYVRRKIETTIGHDPDLVIVLSGHNEFLWPYVEQMPNKIMARFAVTRSAMRKLERFLTPGQDEVESVRYDPYERDTPLFAAKLETYQANLNHIASLTEAHDVPLLLLTAPANIADWPPMFRRSHRDGEPFTGLLDRIQRGDPAEAQAAVAQFVSANPNDARAAFLRGQMQLKLADYEGAYHSLQRARELDAMPWRALSAMNHMVRDISARTEAHLVDIEQVFEQHAERRLVGRQLVSDNCHPAPLGSALMAQAVLQTMQQAGYFVSKEPPNHDASSLLSTYLGQYDQSRENQLAANFQLLNGVYAMKPPFFNYQAAISFLEGASRLNPERWNIWANLGTAHLFDGDVDLGHALLERAAELRGEPIDADTKAVPFLQEALDAAATRS